MNSLWTITYGGYQLAVDRRTLTYHLTETKTNTVWAEGLSLGWMEIRERATGDITRHAFGDMKIFSVSEKAGPQGKRILFGLDCQGVPVDIYLIGAESEIQMVVESNRDSKTHTVEGFCLLPNLCAISANLNSFIVLPYRHGVICYPQVIETCHLPAWSYEDGVTMPFIGAVRNTNSGGSALCLITDSAYAGFAIHSKEDGALSAGVCFDQDPEKRRFDLRIILLPNGDHISIARTYREKLLSDHNHVTLRQKIQEHPEVKLLLGSAWFRLPLWDLVNNDIMSAQEVLTFAEEIQTNCAIRQAVFLFEEDPRSSADLSNLSESLLSRGIVATVMDRLDANETRLPVSILQEETGATGYSALFLGEEPLSTLFDGDIDSPTVANRWEEMERRLARLSDAQKVFPIIGVGGCSDWAIVAVTFLDAAVWVPGRESCFAVEPHRKIKMTPVPLLATIYHDAIVLLPEKSLSVSSVATFLQSLIFLLPPVYNKTSRLQLEFIRRTYAVLGELHNLTFPAFLTAHRFLTANFAVEEAIYSDKTRIVINQNETESYETEDLILPPLGFYVRHRQMEAFDALQVGEKEYPTRAWRIARSQDGKSLEQSEDILRQEFPIP